MLRDLVLKNRSFRRYYQDDPVDMATLRELIDLARLTPSGANLQPLKYVISNTPAQNARIFPTLAWAGYLADWPGPGEGERPSAYIVILCDKTISQGPGCDHGIAAQTLLLGAAEKGLGGCMIGSIKRNELAQILELPQATERYEIVLVIALGKPKETVILDTVDATGSIQYWREADGAHHVPKRPLDAIIVE